MSASIRPWSTWAEMRDVVRPRPAGPSPVRPAQRQPLPPEVATATGLPLAVLEEHASSCDVVVGVDGTLRRFHGWFSPPCPVADVVIEVVRDEMRVRIARRRHGDYVGDCP